MNRFPNRFPHNGNRPSRGEKLMSRWLRIAFPHERILFRYTDKNFAPYEIDAFFPERKLAVEYHGEHHVTNIGFRDEEKQRERDKRKSAHCARLGIKLIVLYACDLTRTHIERLFGCAITSTEEVEALERTSTKYRNGLIRCGNTSAHETFRDFVGWPTPHQEQEGERR